MSTLIVQRSSSIRALMQTSASGEAERSTRVSRIISIRCAAAPGDRCAEPLHAASSGTARRAQYLAPGDLACAFVELRQMERRNSAMRARTRPAPRLSGDFARQTSANRPRTVTPPLAGVGSLNPLARLGAERGFKTGRVTTKISNSLPVCAAPMFIAPAYRCRQVTRRHLSRRPVLRLICPTEGPGYRQ